MAPGHSAARPQAGFTLVELLLAVTLISLLLGLAYGGMRAATRASESGQAQLEQSGRLRITHQFLRRQLNLMLPLAYESEGEDEDDGYRRMFTGSAESIQFVGPMPGYLGTGGPQVQYLEVAQGENGLALTFRHALLENFKPDDLFVRDPVVLLDGLASVNFEFLEPAEDLGVRPANPVAAQDVNNEMPGEWVTEWALEDQIPLVVRLDIAYADGSKVSWPTLYAAPRLDPAALGGANMDQDYGKAIRDLIRRQSPGDNN